LNKKRQAHGANMLQQEMAITKQLVVVIAEKNKFTQAIM
jgi:hypothetical protein